MKLKVGVGMKHSLVCLGSYFVSFRFKIDLLPRQRALEKAAAGNSNRRGKAATKPKDTREGEIMIIYI
jgi:hypothetical protein